MKVYIKEPGKKPKVTDIENTLKALQEIVGGYIETVTLSDRSVLIVNEEGLPRELPYNCTVITHSLMPFQTFGTIVLVGRYEDGFTSVSETLESHGREQCRCYLLEG